MKTINIICNTQICKGTKREYQYVRDQDYLNGQKLYEVFQCPVCNRAEGFHFTDFYINLMGWKR